MKKIKAILVRDFSVSIALQAAAIAFIAVPQLEGFRLRLASLIKLPEHLLWAPVLVILLCVNGLILLRFKRKIAEPVHDLANQSKLTTRSFAFKKKSQSWEEDVLKHYIEGQSLRRAEMERQVEEQEAEIEKLLKEIDDARELNATCDTRTRELQETIESLKEENAALKAQIPDPNARNAETEARVEAEVEKRASELCAKVEAALANASRKTSSAGSSLLHEVREPLARISALAKQMIDSWADTSLTRLKAAVAEILSHSEQELERIDALADGKPEPAPAQKNSLLESLSISSPTNGGSSRRNGLTASLRGAVTGLVRRHSAQSDRVEVEAEIDQAVEDGIQDRAFLDVLDNLLDLAVCQLQDGVVKLEIYPRRDGLELSVNPQGAPRLGNTLDLTKVNRAAHALEGKIEVDGDGPGELRLRFRFNPYDRAPDRVFEL